MKTDQSLQWLKNLQNNLLQQCCHFKEGDRVTSDKCLKLISSKHLTPVSPKRTHFDVFFGELEVNPHAIDRSSKPY